ncbi:unnamed protein product [Ixodes hexagonus]
MSLIVACMAQDELVLTRASNVLGLRLLKALPSSRDDNIVLSPYGVFNAIGMIYAGARHSTQQELFQGIGFHEYRFRYRRALEAFASRTRRLETPQFNSTLDVANGVAIQQTLPLLKSYENLLERSFGADVHKVDFSGAAVDVINDWVRNKTRDAEGLFRTPFTKDMQLVLLNTIGFKGYWDTKFDKKLTTKRPFFNGGETLVQVDTMTGKLFAGHKSLRFFHADVIELPYYGADYSMVLLLPKRKDGIEELKEEINSEVIGALGKGLKRREVTVFLPRFKLEAEYSLKKQLRSLGIERIFEEDADLSRITSADELRVSELVHKAVVLVNEDGGEAAAATGVAVARRSLYEPHRPEPTVFRFEHPFLFFIRNTQTGDILFAGQVNRL